MRILVVSHGLELGGIERSLIGLLGPLVDARNQVDLLLFRAEGELMPLLDPRVRLLDPDPVLGHLKTPIPDAFKAGLLRLGLLRLLVKARSLLARAVGQPTSQVAHLTRWANHLVGDLPGSYDVVLGFQGPHDFILKHVDAKVRLGWVHTDYSTLRPDTRFEEPMWDGLDRIVVVSESAKDAFLDVFPALRQKMLVIENTLDSAMVRRLASETAAPHIDGPGSGVLRLCTVGRYSHAKAFDRAVDACAELVQAGRDVVWYAVGYGPDEEPLRQRISAKSLQDSFILVGKQTNPYPYMAACDIYVQPSRYEGKAVAVREAQTLGKPVLITDFPTSPSQLTDDWDGIICGSSPTELAAAIQGLADDRALRERLSANCAASDYSNKGAVEELLAELRKLV